MVERGPELGTNDSEFESPQVESDDGAVQPIVERKSEPAEDAPELENVDPSIENDTAKKAVAELPPIELIFSNKQTIEPSKMEEAVMKHIGTNSKEDAA